MNTRKRMVITAVVAASMIAAGPGAASACHSQRGGSRLAQRGRHPRTIQPAASQLSTGFTWRPLHLLNGWKALSPGTYGAPSYAVRDGVLYLSGILQAPRPTYGPEFASSRPRAAQALSVDRLLQLRRRRYQPDRQHGDRARWRHVRIFQRRPDAGSFTAGNLVPAQFLTRHRWPAPGQTTSAAGVAKRFRVPRNFARRFRRNAPPVIVMEPSSVAGRAGNPFGRIIVPPPGSLRCAADAAAEAAAPPVGYGSGSPIIRAWPATAP